MFFILAGKILVEKSLPKSPLFSHHNLGNKQKNTQMQKVYPLRACPLAAVAKPAT
jgi:hypothetical protein